MAVNAPPIATSGNNVYTVWVEPIPGTIADFNTFFIKSNDDGVVFGPTENISNNDDSGNSTLDTTKLYMLTNL
jgi:hypothetical protein